MIDYIFYSVVGLGCSFFVYQLFLKNQKSFNFNRFFLLASLILCLIAPLLEIETVIALPRLADLNFDSSQAVDKSHELMHGITVSEIEKSHNPLASIVWGIYLIITAIFIFRFVQNLLHIAKLSKQSTTSIGRFHIIETEDRKNVSSFFNYLFIDSACLADVTLSNPIIKHEKVHADQYHTIDLILLEFLLCLFWFNPFIWLYRKIIIQNHEFLADAQTVKSGVDLEHYSQLLINSGLMEHRVPITSGFNFIQIKNRIIMLHQSESTSLQRSLRIALAVALSTGIFMFSSFKNLKEPLVVVVDAGHGGHDSGSLNEKDVVLSVSRYLSQLSDQDIKIISVREEDKFMNLNERIQFINDQKADFFLSLHCNAHDDVSVNGVEAFYYDKSPFKKQSRNYSEILVKNQVDLFAEQGKVKKAEFLVLKKVSGPAVLLELGFLSNTKDREILSNTDNQQAIAKSIFKSLKQIRNSK